MNIQRSLDWNYSRRATRDLLLEYDQMIIPPRPDSPEFKSIYPWESVGLSILGDQIYMLASRSGYPGSREEFQHNFGSYLERNKWEILFESFDNFPVEGQSNKLYFDIDENTLYYWNGQYLPVNAMLIANTIVNGGDA